MMFSMLLSACIGQRAGRQIRELYSATIILNLALAMVAVFEPIYLFVLFRDYVGVTASVVGLLMFYLGVYVLYLVLVPLGARVALRIGYERSMALGTCAIIALYLCLFAAPWAPVPFLLLAIVCYALQKMLYWPAYHADFARFSSDGQQGWQISVLIAFLSLVSIAGPLIGGALLESYGFSFVFITVAILVASSNIPMLLTTERFTPQPFPYLAAYRRLASPGYRRRTMAYMGFAEELIAVTLWPLFIFLIVSDYLGLGLLAAAATLVSTLIVLLIGRISDGAHDRLVAAGTILYAASWIMRIMPLGPFGIMLLDAFARTTKQAVNIPLTAVTYAEAQSSSVMTTVVHFELSLVVGKILMILLTLVAIALVGLNWPLIFFISGALSLLYLAFLVRGTLPAIGRHRYAR